MATLVLTAVGTAVGGPIGGAIGALVGQSVDRSLLAPKGRQGPRLSELRVQLSSYGAEVPRLFGTMRVAGTVIWSTDLIESRSTGRAGKGQPSVTSYSYAASFAVLLSGRPIREVGRIWADGQLLRGAAGDWKAATGFRLHLGGEDQAVDPLIASAVGAGLAPAHRGCAYAVFEGLQLADYGNRIPSLTFEVIADEGAVSVGAVARAIAPEVTGGAAMPLGGFAAAGGSLRAVLDTLGELGGAWFAGEGAGVAMRDGGEGGDEGGAAVLRDAGVAGGRGERSVTPLSAVPRVLSVGHYDPARDYQTGVQRASRPGAGTREERIEAPAALTADAAKALAQAGLLRREAARVRRVISLGLEGLAIGPGQVVALADEPGRWRVAEARVEGMATRLTLVPLAGMVAGATGADGGRVLAAPDRVVGRTLLAAFETPGLDDTPLAAPRLTVAAAGTGVGWRAAALMLSLDSGASWQPAGGTAAPAVLGALTAAVPPGPATLFDEAGAIEVALSGEAVALGDADDRQLDGGANLALVGDELVQFGRAVPLGGGRWRLTRLLRGRRGTEEAAGVQGAGDRFVLLEADAARTIELPLAAIGTDVRVMAVGVGDGDAPVEAAVAVTGVSVRPPSPVELAFAREEAGARVTWRRRSRAGWRWLDGVDAPLGEEAESYRVVIAPALGDVREVVVGAAAVTVPFALLAEGPVTVSVRQRGTFGESAPASILIEGIGA